MDLIFGYDLRWALNFSDTTLKGATADPKNFSEIIITVK